MQKKSAGLLMYKVEENIPYFFLVHPGGPFWKNRDKGAWSIPKGEISDNERELDAAVREMKEETGITAKEPFADLGEIKQKSGKIVRAWAFQGNFTMLMSSSFIEIEFPPNSGKKIKIPEIDNACMFTKEQAREKIIPAQFEFIERLEKLLCPKA